MSNIYLLLQQLLQESLECTYLILFHWIYLSNVWTFVCNNISIFVRNYSSSISKWSRYCDYSFIYNTFWNWFLTILFQEKFSKLKKFLFFFFHSRKYFVHIQSDLWPKKKKISKQSSVWITFRRKCSSKVKILDRKRR